MVAIVALGLGATTGCTAAGAIPSDSASAFAQLATTPRLQGADNFRDVGGIGAGYATTDGGHVARGVVYRSNALTLTDQDLAALTRLNITDIVDLRTPDEIAAQPDTIIPGAERRNDDVLGTSGPSAMPSFTSPAEAEAMMDGLYESMVTSAQARTAIAAALTTIAEADGTVVIHCTAGKDRTGWTSALLLHLAGADRPTIDQNYLLTNQYSRASISAALAGIAEQNGEDAPAAYAPLLGVEQEFLDHAWDAAEKEYGSLDGYLTTGLGLSKETLRTLKDRLTA